MRIFKRQVSRDQVYVVSGAARIGEQRAPDMPEFRIDAVPSMTSNDWKEISQLQGHWAARYLRFKYGSRETRLLTARLNGQLAHVQWIVPSAVIHSRYPFVKKFSFAIIACITAPKFRGFGIYPAGIIVVAESGISDKYYIWANVKNTSSLKGIEKARGVKIGHFVQFKALRGLLSKVSFSEDSFSD